MCLYCTTNINGTSCSTQEYSRQIKQSSVGWLPLIPKMFDYVFFMEMVLHLFPDVYKRQVVSRCH